ncbi:MAG: hypothetical protein IPP22_06770 [Nitrosomonas sp.]|nr:hypothetical protein [Nitrosomonas sp.]
MLKKIINLSVTFVLSLFPMSAITQVHLHEGDIQPWRIGAEIFLNTNLFEPDFGDIGEGLYTTDEPGFEVNIAKKGHSPRELVAFSTRRSTAILEWH